MSTMKRFASLSSFTPVTPGSTTTLSPTPDRRYQAAYLLYKGGAATRANIEADIGRIRVKLDGATQWELTAQQLLAFQEVRGYPFIDGCIPLHFAEPWMRAITGEDAGALPLQGNVGSFEIEIEIDANAVSPTLECFFEYDGVVAPLKNMRKFYTSQVQVSSVGKITLSDLPFQGALHGIHCFEQNVGDIERIRVQLSTGVAVYDAPRAINEARNLQQGAKNLPGVFSVLFNADQRILSLLPDAVAINGEVMQRVTPTLEFEMTAANPFVMLYEFWGQPVRGG